MKHILLTGATGMIGSAIVREALKRDCEVTCIIRANSARAVNIPKDGRVHIVDCDISDYASLEFSGNYDAFMHLAWDKTSVGGRDDVDCQLKNIQYTLDAVRLAKRCGCKVFIGAGSQAEYGVKAEPLTCSMPVNPESGYGIAKFAAGKFSGMLCKQLGLRYNWIRILSVYGKNDSPNTLISYAARECQAGRNPEFTKCEQIWDYLNCQDAARAFFAVAEKGVDGKTYPLGSGRGRPLSDYVKAVRDAVNPAIKIEFGKKPYYPHQPMYLVADVSELTEDTGWKAEIDFERGIIEMLQGDENA